MTIKNTDPIDRSSYRTGDTILTVLCFTSMGLTIWGINIYRLTIIDTKFLFATIALGVIIALAILTFSVRSSYSSIWTFLIKAAIGGGFFYFALLFLNQRFGDKEFKTEQFLIVKKGTLGKGRSSSCFQPYVDIDFNGIEKELVFYCDYADAVKNATKINLTYSKGAFGFVIINSKQLTK